MSNSFYPGLLVYQHRYLLLVVDSIRGYCVSKVCETIIRYLSYCRFIDLRVNVAY